MIDIPSAALAELFAQTSRLVLPVLLEISHSVVGYESPIRIVNNTVDLVYGGNVYRALRAFKYDPPSLSVDGTVKNASITLCAVDQTLAAIIRSASEAATVKAVAAYYIDADHFEPIQTWSHTMRNVRGTADVIQAELVYEERLDNVVPSGEFNSHFPAII